MNIRFKSELIVLFMLCAFFFASCSKNNAQEAADKLLETVINPGGRITKLEYDSEERIVKCHKYNNDELIETFTLAYSDGKLTHIERTPSDDHGQIYFSIEENRIILRGIGAQITFFINDDGYIQRKLEVDPLANTEASYVYENGFLVKRIISNRYQDGYGGTGIHEITEEYKYDDKASALNCNTPKWFLQYIFGDHAGSSNIVYLSDNFGSYQYEYEFNSSGYPVNRTTIMAHGGTTDYEVTYFFYRGEEAVIKHTPAAVREQDSESHDSMTEGSSNQGGANENRFKSFAALFEHIINSEKITSQIFENDEFLLNSRNVLRIDYEENGNFTVYSNDINIDVFSLGSVYQISKITINPNSKYLNLFPYNNFIDYSSNTDLGEIREISNVMISYEFLQFNYIWNREYFVVRLYFNGNGTLRNAEIGFPLG